VPVPTSSPLSHTYLFTLFAILLAPKNPLFCFPQSEAIAKEESSLESWWYTNNDADAVEAKQNLENELSCCGWNSVTDHPVGTCPSDATNGCKQDLMDITQDSLLVLNIVAWILLGIELIAFLAAMVICCARADDDERVRDLENQRLLGQTKPAPQAPRDPYKASYSYGNVQN
jgi:hypothetical protein